MGGPNGDISTHESAAGLLLQRFDELTLADTGDPLITMGQTAALISSDQIVAKSKAKHTGQGSLIDYPVAVWVAQLLLVLDRYLRARDLVRSAGVNHFVAVGRSFNYFAILRPRNAQA